MFTSHQLTEIAFNHLDTAEDRLRTLTTRGVLDRFRPRRDRGSAPFHYVLGPLGAVLDFFLECEEWSNPVDRRSCLITRRPLVWLSG